MDGNDARTVLVVDDELAICVPVKFLLEKAGYRVALAQSGKEALEQVRDLHPDLVLLDIMLPDLDGYEIFQMIRAERRFDDIRIIFLSAKNQGVDVARGLNLGADAYITKPFDNADLLAQVAEVLNRPAVRARRLEESP